MQLQWLGGLGALGVRLAKMVAVILLIAVFNFMLVRAAPGDPALVIAGQSGATDEAFLARVRADYGLDRPLPAQLATYLGKIVTLDLGYSHRQQRTVASAILERLPATLLLTLSAFAISLAGGIQAKNSDAKRTRALYACKRSHARIFNLNPF